jgi:arsenate reductase (thioredoxin)
MKTILFVCVENSCRSQMAEGFARALGKGVVEAYSAGTKPSGTVDAGAIAAMKEVGIDIAAQKSKGFFDLPVREFDCVVTMGCGDVCPLGPGKEHIDWQIDDPKGQDIEVYRTARNIIRAKVEQMLKDIGTMGGA